MAGHHAGHDVDDLPAVGLGCFRQGAFLGLADPLAILGQGAVCHNPLGLGADHEDVLAAHIQGPHRLGSGADPGDADARDNDIGRADDGDAVRGQVDKCCHFHTP